ncbi:hypothetical protein HMPREF9441_01670 [Paraprevotella clara YIT 11840]|uniref:Lipoprotein n=2 Tax=Paraprevotella clara TaxID=454154 RepID=G5SQN0_9BACT|nr:hypothetical protein HMPREF9441_01670 [Paraprevotella clara YIT 11840]
MRMKRIFGVRGLALLLVGVGMLAYSCSGDGIFEEEEDVRSLAKRAMYPSGEGLSPSTGTSKVEAGSWKEDVKCPHGEVEVSVSWTRGYTSGVHNNSDMATISGSVYSSDTIVINPRISDLDWEGAYHIGGELTYDYVKWEYVTDWKGNKKLQKNVYYNNKYVFHLSNPIKFVEEEDDKKKN